ncbi:hypothetical protein FRY74_04905 [Vicingus serpentipes]|uniref:TonB C-terminal domain-containing protein n=1 Tax=Vicingus serpentipes TaxID=1926625 RepID=A0A5C6RVZ7_9FLAO|nr:hypothetical protein FRY74_04905 [Vicingus serpentipes]
MYPQKALEARITGTITLIFDIDSACNFINISQDTTLGYGCDEFALKTLQHVEEQRKIENKLKCKKSYNHKIPVKFRLE